MPDLVAHFTPSPDWTFYHGTPDERHWQHGAVNGIHVGTEEAAHQALNARIGRPLEGRWDGTREYGKTLLSPYQRTGTERDLENARYPSGRATYTPDASGHAHLVPLDARPNVFPVRITGPMINHPAIPVEDDYANSRLRGQITRGNAKRGYFYRNVGEDEGSISAAVPSAAHLERLDAPKTAGLLEHFGAYEGPPGEGFPNAYHGSSRFGGRPEWRHTWFHGTRGVPEFGERRSHGQDELAKPPDERKMAGGWAQPNQLHGVHFSPLHEVAHKFAGSVSSTPGAIVHARLNFSNPAHFESEHHLNIAMADWGSRHYPAWHNDKLNASMAWNYSDSEGTRRDFSRAPDDHRELRRLGNQAQSLLQWHPHMPEILKGFTADLRGQGHRGITYGNGLEGPYETDAGRGGEAAMKYITKRENWPHGSPYSISAIAQPEDIQTTHVEHISPWRAEPEPHERTWEDVSDGDEDDAMRDRVLAYHRFHGGAYPRDEHTVARRTAALRAEDYKGTTGNNFHITRNEYGMIPTSVIARMPGVRGEVPGEHRNMDDADEWPEFKEDIARNGIREPVFITVNHGEEPKLSEGNHRRDAAVALGISHVPAEIRYFGHAEHQGTVLERAGHHEAAAGYPRRASSSGDRFVTCQQGHEHWGAYGAAGLLIRHRGEDGRQRYLLQKRSPYVNEPDTWSVPGGAIGRDESPEQGAWREAREEMGSIPKHVRTHHVVKSTDCGDWAYHTVVADAGEHFMPGGRGETQHETAGVGWHTADEIDELRKNGDLHPGFARSWDAVRRSRGPRTAAVDFHKPIPPEQKICGTCGWPRNRHQEFDRLYHATSPSHRHSIRDTGLRVEFEQGYGVTEPGVYMSPRPDEHNTDQDIWEVDARGMRVHPDDPGNQYEFRDVGGSHFSAEDIPPERLKLHYKGRGNKWTGYPPKEAVITPRTEHEAADIRYRQYVQRIHPRDLMQYAQREAWRMQDPGGRRHISELAEGIRQRGYRPSEHGGMSGDTHSYPPSFPITLCHDDDQSWLWNGHHRVFALNEAGYDKPVPVLVKDFRTQGRTAAWDASGSDQAAKVS